MFSHDPNAYLRDAVNDDEDYLRAIETLAANPAAPQVVAYLQAARATRTDGSFTRTALYAHNRANAAQNLLDADARSIAEVGVASASGEPGFVITELLKAEIRVLRLAAGMLDGHHLAPTVRAPRGWDQVTA